MKRWWTTRLIVYTLLACTLPFLGCAATRPVEPPSRFQVSATAYSADLIPMLGLWTSEIGARYGDVTILAVHGTSENGEWVAHYSFGGVVPMKQLVREAKAAHPDRLLVVVACNPGKHRLGIPGVLYALDDIWAIPDQFMAPEVALIRRAQHPTAVGSIRDFVRD